MQVIFLIPCDFSCDDYNRIEHIKEIRPLKLVYYEAVLENICKEAINLKKEIGKSINKNISNTFVWNKEKYSLESFDQLIIDIQNNLIKCQNIYKSMEKEDPDSFSNIAVEDSYEFVSVIYVIVDNKDNNKFQSLFPSMTIKNVKENKSKTLYAVYCLKKEREKTIQWLKNKGFSIYNNPRKIVKEIKVSLEQHEEMTLMELIDEINELVLIVHTAKGLAESLNKYSISCGYKYKIVSKDKENCEYSNIKKENKITNFEDSMTKILLDV